eukprot:9278556-Pyramimonas_sp.AAC.2
MFKHGQIAVRTNPRSSGALRVFAHAKYNNVDYERGSDYRYSYGARLWGTLVCTLAITSTGGPVKRPSDVITTERVVTLL